MVSGQVTIQVNPLPLVELGVDQSICTGDSVTLIAGEGFASYLWSTGETTPSITVKTTGEYSVTVTNEFDCSSNDLMNLTVLDMPATPVIASGPATVDNFRSTSSTYTCGASANATSYEWYVTPVSAGTISGTGTSATLTWADEFTGNVTVTVAAMNDCFTSAMSTEFATTVFTSAGLDEIAGGKQLVIFPNPTDGKITIKLPAQMAFTGDLFITDANGATVMSKTGLNIASGESYNMDLNELAEGVYTIKLSSNSSVFFGRVVIK